MQLSYQLISPYEFSLQCLKEESIDISLYKRVDRNEVF